jgi:hypothetical protein
MKQKLFLTVFVTVASTQPIFAQKMEFKKQFLTQAQVNTDTVGSTITFAEKSSPLSKKYLIEANKTQVFDSKIKPFGLDKFYVGQDRGGGDPCENQIKIIRSDLSVWIQKGGPKELRLPDGIFVDQYSTRMLQKIEKAKVRCVGQGDKDFPVEVYGTPKVCKFEVDSNQDSTITCDRSAFLALDESEQYVLVHHEYAGLAGIEIPLKDYSQYEVSNQITSFLENKIVKRLVVKPAQLNPMSKWQLINGKEAADIARGLQDALANTNFADCKVELESEAQPPSAIQCGGGIYYYNRFNFISTIDPKSGFRGIPVGNFDCQDSKEEKNRFLMKSTEGPIAFLNTLDKNVYPEKGEHGLHLRLNSIFELDSTETSIAKITITKSKIIQVNKGTVGNPKWADESVALNTLTCHKSR